MSSYNNLGVTGQNYISEQLYKSLFGYPDGKIGQSLGNEIPGTSRINIFNNQIFEQLVPPVAPSNLDMEEIVFITNLTTQASEIVGVKRYSSAHPYIVKYDSIRLSSSELTPSLAYWFIGSNLAYSNTPALQASNNLLSQGIPGNFDPALSYSPTLFINSNAYTFGNSQYPWIYNPNSGIVSFTGSGFSTGIPNNNIPSVSYIVTFTFWRYEGTIGITGPTGQQGPSFNYVNLSTVLPDISNNNYIVPPDVNNVYIKDTNFNTWSQPSISNINDIFTGVQITSSVVDSNNILYFGGVFLINGLNNICMYNGDSFLPLANGLDNLVTYMVIDSNNNLYKDIV